MRQWVLIEFCSASVILGSMAFATRGGAELKLTPKEFALLSFLAKHAGRALTHKQILTVVWGPAHTEDTQYLRELHRPIAT